MSSTIARSSYMAMVSPCIGCVDKIKYCQVRGDSSHSDLEDVAQHLCWVHPAWGDPRHLGSRSLDMVQPLRDGRPVADESQQWGAAFVCAVSHHPKSNTTWRSR